MYPQRRMVSQALRLGLLVALVVLAMSACGGEKQQQESKSRPLPEDPQALRPGEYRSEEFKPSLSFKVGKGWSSTPLEASDHLAIARGETAGIGFENVQEVYKPTTGTPNVVEAPRDLVSWFQQHPYLKTDKPEQITVGEVKGEQFDVVIEDLPEDYAGGCQHVVVSVECVDLYRQSTGQPVFLTERYKVRVIVLEDVGGETVSIGIGSPATEFDEFAPEAQKVVDTVEWRGS